MNYLEKKLAARKGKEKYFLITPKGKIIQGTTSPSKKGLLKKAKQLAKQLKKELRLRHVIEFIKKHLIITKKETIAIIDPTGKVSKPTKLTETKWFIKTKKGESMGVDYGKELPNILTKLEVQDKKIEDVLASYLK